MPIVSSQSSSATHAKSVNAQVPSATLTDSCYALSFLAATMLCVCMYICGMFALACVAGSRSSTCEGFMGPVGAKVNAIKQPYLVPCVCPRERICD